MSSYWLLQGPASFDWPVFEKVVGVEVLDCLLLDSADRSAKMLGLDKLGTLL